ncbi:phage tail tape measure protein [Citrobacter youngae]|uniref:phage tail tape measure protein n=1 Tax=Citrobacter youngae TaxID=133448 RepID=UPI00191769B9|nr:phage tail tape measure protein [Citrobacter youngae]MBK6259105.1 phage tail tape measure protein [Citrobacter youngae]
MKTLDIRIAFSAIDKLTRPVETARQSVGGLSDSLKKTQSDIKSLGTQSKAFARLRENFTKTTEKIQTAQRELNGLRQAQQAGNVMTDKQREHMAQLAAKLDRLNEVRAREKERLREATAVMVRHGITLSGSDRTIQSAIRRTEQYNQTLERERQMLARVTQARARYEQSQKAAEKLRNVGAAAVAAGSVGLYAGSRMIAPQIEAEGHGSVIAAQTGEGAASGERYTRIIQDLNSSGISSNLDQAAEALSVVRSGLGALGDVGDSELSRISRKALDMQKALGGDLSEHIQTAAIMMKNGLAGSSDEAIDLMAAGMQRMSAQMRGELPEILHEYSTHFRNMGFSGNEAMSLLVDMAKQGKFALDKTGDAIKEFSIRGSDMSKGSVSAYESIGLSAATMSSAIATGGAQARDAMQKTARGLLAISDPAERANSAIALFGTPIEDLSVDQIPAFLSALAGMSDQIGDVQGTADRMGNTLRDNLPGDIARLTGALSGLRTDIFSSLSGDLRVLTQTATEWINQLREWVQANPSLTKTLVIVSGVVLALTVAVGGLSLAIGLLLGPIAKLKLGFAVLTKLPALASGFSVIPSMFGAITGAVSGLGGTLSLLLSSVGLVGVAFVAAGLLIWKYWEPIKAFFAGVFSGIMERLAPLRESFAQFSPLFDAISNGIIQVWGWFKELLTPMESSKETLDKCASAGEIFGNVLGGALQLVLIPAKALMDSLAWILEKLGVLPDEAEKARRKLDDLKKEPVMWEWDPQQKKMVKKEWKPSPPKVETGTTPPPPAHTPLTGDQGTQRRLQKISDNTGGMLQETKKRIGPGDIVFKNLPRALAVRGEWQESKLARTSAAIAPPLAPVVAAAAAPVVQAMLPPVRRSGDSARNDSAAGGFNGEIHVHLHDVVTQNPRELAKTVGEMVKAELDRLTRAGRGSFRDRD